MLIIFCYIIMTYGLSNILVHGYGPFDIIDKFRELINKVSMPIGKMFECMMCTSTNIGMFLSILDIFFINNINFTPFNILFNEPCLWYLIIPFDMFFTSGSVWVIHTIQNYIESSTEI